MSIGPASYYKYRKLVEIADVVEMGIKTVLYYENYLKM